MFRNFSMLNAEEKEHALLNEVGELLICMSSTTTSDADGLNQNMVINLWTLAFTEDEKTAKDLLEDICKEIKAEAYSRLRSMSFPDYRSVDEKPKKKQSKRERNRQNKIDRTRGVNNAFA
jgi:hypothetical protein